MFPSFLALPNLASDGIAGNKIFWDIGCGTAKPVAIAAMSQKFSAVKGVEYLSDVAKLGKDACEDIV